MFDEQLSALGQWVQVAPADGIEAYGIVSYVEMVPLDEGRKAVALEKTQDELRREMPQVMELLRTVVRVQVVAHREFGMAIRQMLPPYPPRIHTPVFAVPPQPICEIASPYDFLRVLLINAEASAFTEDLLVVVLSGLKRAHPAGDSRAVVEAGKMLSRLLRDDVERLQSILRRVALEIKALRQYSAVG